MTLDEFLNLFTEEAINSTKYGQIEYEFLIELKSLRDELEVYKRALDWLADRCETLDMVANPTFESICLKAKRWKEIALQKAREE